MKNNIVFDLDGTLTDSGPGIKNSVRYTLNHYGLPMEDDVSLNRYVGPPLMTSFRTFMRFPEEQIPEAIMVYRRYFEEKGMLENEVYPGIPKLLTVLKTAGKRLFIATGKPTVYAKQILEHFGMTQYFECVCGIGMDETAMGKDELIAKVLEQQGLDPRDCVMIGDRKYDIIGAQKTGVYAIGVTYGYGSRVELLDAGADIIAETVTELQEILLQ